MSVRASSSNARLLVVEDDPDISMLLAHSLGRAGFAVETLSSGAEVLAEARRRTPDLILLDLMLPGLDGLEVCRALRADPATASMPVIMLTARAEESDRIVGLELGADDYITKPFSPNEVVARVRALLRRAQRPDSRGLLRYGPLVVDVERHTVSLDGGGVHLTAKEFLLLQYLLEHQGRVLSRDLLLSDVWGYAYTGGTRTVDVHVRRLREKLPLLAESLQTVKQFGYKLAEPPGVMRTVRGKLFVATFVVGALSALAVGLVLNVWLGRLTVQRIEQTLGAETRLAAEMLTRNPTIPASALDEEADRIGVLVGVRVTFIAPDGTVLGDSTQSGTALAAMENHGKRPEIIAAARTRGEVHVRRYSTTTEYDTLYAAIPITHPAVAYVRLALPLTGIAEQRRDILLLSLAGVLASLPIAALLSWAVTAPMASRVSSIAEVARRYATGDLTKPLAGYGEDELGEVARALDGAVQQLGKRVNELAHDRRHLRAILSGMAEGVVVVDDHGRLVMANEAARVMLKLDDSATGRRYQEWMRQPEIFAQLAAAIDGEAPLGVEFTLARDPSRTCVARAAPAGEPEGGAILVLHDISDLRRADRVRRDFVANVSHELRTPLTAIRGYVEALMDEPASSDQSRQFLEIIARHTDRMERLVKDLLRLARLDAGQETTDLVECDLYQLLQGVVNELAGALSARETAVSLEVAADMRSLVSDPAKLHDVVRNLLENAVNYSPEGAPVRIEAFRDGGDAILRVIDAGPGIPPSDLGRVFERFYRVEKSRAREPGGTGIGLAIVKHVVGLLNGTVTAENGPESGAVFTVRLPLVSGAEVQAGTGAATTR